MSGLLVSAQTLRSDIDEIEVPEDPCEDEDDDRRLWVGNLSNEITEYCVVKMMQKFGTLRKMNFIYHKAGPDKGKPKGYCFVSFNTWEAAEKARKALDGKTVMFRKLYVKWANRMKQDEKVVTKSKVKPAAASSSSVTSAASAPPSVAAALTASSAVETASTEAKIKAIEAKLRMMDQTQKDFSLNVAIQPPLGLNVAQKKQESRSAPYRKSCKPRR